MSIIENNKKIHRASIVGDNEIVNYMYVKVGHNGPVAIPALISVISEVCNSINFFIVLYSKASLDFKSDFLRPSLINPYKL